MIFSLWKALINMESHTSTVSPCMPIRSVSIGEARQFIVKIPRIYATFMGYWIAGQVRDITRSVIWKSKLRMGENLLRRVLMIPRAVFLRAYLRITRSIYLLDSGRGRVDGPGDELCLFWLSLGPCPRPTRLPGHWCWIGTGRHVHRFDTWWL